MPCRVQYCCPCRYHTADLSTLVVIQKCVGAQPQKKKTVLVPCKIRQKSESTHIFFEQNNQVFVVSLFSGLMLWSWALPLIFSHFPPFILRSRSLVPHSFPHAPLRPPPNHLTSHLMDYLTIPQSTITCHHSAVRSTPQYHHLTPYGLPAHDALFLDCQLMMELYLELPCHDTPY